MDWPALRVPDQKMPETKGDPMERKFHQKFIFTAMKNKVVHIWRKPWDAKPAGKQFPAAPRSNVALNLHQIRVI